MHFSGLVIGLATFLVIGLFHPLVIKAEYHFGTGCWWAFALAGAAACAASLFVAATVPGTILGVVGFSCFWSIHELFQQRRRVERGWFPKKERKP